ncbi:helix-turn-helix domain-containing protein [Winogradskyella sp.]|uniref:helix-turn-helix domain-containing protein n=1 Tax=Winogradskyella sp. TaxID=1883156 RepID=UPI003AB5AEAB
MNNKQNSPNTLDEIKAISFFSTSLYHKNSVEEVLWDITKNVIQQLGFVDCVIYVFDKEKGVLHQKAAYGQKNPYEEVIYNQLEILLGNGIVGSVAKTKKPELIPNTKYDRRYIIDDEERSSEICIPIVMDDTLFGVIDSEHPEANFFNQKHLHLLTIIATLCAQKIKEIQTKTRKPFTRANHYFKKLESLMQFRKIYRNPCLTLSSTAKDLGISACYLSSMINNLLNKSFIDFINEYRIEDVKNNLHSEEFSGYTIVSVGLEAGFNSKSAFYSAFKKHTGLTPMAYKSQSVLRCRHS